MLNALRESPIKYTIQEANLKRREGEQQKWCMQIIGIKEALWRVHVVCHYNIVGIMMHGPSIIQQVRNAPLWEQYIEDIDSGKWKGALDGVALIDVKNRQLRIWETESDKYDIDPLRVRWKGWEVSVGELDVERSYAVMEKEVPEILKRNEVMPDREHTVEQMIMEIAGGTIAELIQRANSIGPVKIPRTLRQYRRAGVDWKVKIIVEAICTVMNRTKEGKAGEVKVLL